MDIGTEFPPPPYRTTEAGWEAFSELDPTIAKFRLGSHPDDVQRARIIMGQKGKVLWRPRQEVPTFGQLSVDWHNTEGKLAGDLLELENEPNHPDMQRTNLESLLDFREWHTKLVAPGLMPEAADNPSNTLQWLKATLQLRSQCDYDGVHVYHTQGLNGIMFTPAMSPVPLPKLVTEFGYSGDDPVMGVRLNQQVMEQILDDCVGLVFFILPYEEGPQWSKYFLTKQAAQAYRVTHEIWHDKNNGGAVVTDREKDDLRAMLLDIHATLGDQFISNNPRLALHQIEEAWKRAFEQVGDAINYLDMPKPGAPPN